MEATVIRKGPDLEGAVRLLAAAGLPTEDLRESHCEHFFYRGPRGSPDALIGLELLGDVALLRSLAVADAARGGGLGTALVAHAEEYARREGVSRLYLLTTTAERFFARRGYVPASRADAPAAIRATREFAGLCPASSAFMVKDLQHA